MLTRILHNSPALCDFIKRLGLDADLNQPELRHVLNLADALLVCDGDKTLTELQRQFVECVDPSNMADTLRIAPWTAQQVRQPVGQALIRAALAQAKQAGRLDRIAISIDDSIAPKHKNTHHLEGVDWHYDHVASTPRQPRYVNGLAYLACNVWIGGQAVTFAVRPYLRERTVRQINRARSLDQHLHFISKNRMARQMLIDLQALLPAAVPVYVLHDAWYASARLFNLVHRQGWYTISALKHNRKLDGQRLDQHSLALWHQRYEPVVVTATDGSTTPYFTRSLTGRLEDVAFDLRVIDSKGHPRSPQSAYFGCTDLSLETQTALQIYGHRWGCETDNVYLKSRLGVGDFRVRSYEAIDKYVTVVHLGLAYAQDRLLREAGPHIHSVADVIRLHRDEHTCDWLTGACEEAVATGDIQSVLKHFLRLSG